MQPEPTGRAVLLGTEIRPEIHVSFSWDARHPRTNQLLSEWVKGLPNRRWDGRERTWVVSGTGPDPDGQFRKAGIEVDLSRFEETVFGLNELVAPWVRRSDRPKLALVRPRLAGWKESVDRLGPSAKWDQETGRFEIALIDLVRDDGSPRPGLHIEEEALEAARDALHERKLFHSTRTDTDAHAATAGLSTGIGEQTATASVKHLEAATGGIPDWFGVELYPYQKLGALSAAAGHPLLADDMGLGKTFQSLAVAAITGRRKLLAVVPPIVLTNWKREIVKAGLFTEDQVVIFVSGRKEPDLPDEVGAVVVSDSLLVSRPQLFERLVDWEPDALVYDEAHRMRGLKTARSEMMRDLSDAMLDDTVILALTGTPLFSNPIELLPVLQFVRLLDPVFGGFSAYTERFCRRNNFNQWVARVKALPELRRLLDEHVWVRRHKVDVLPDLPDKSYASTWLDVPLGDYRKANAELAVKINEWLDDFEAQLKRLPDDGEIKEWATGKIGLMSPLRVAAGVAKVPSTVELISDWVESNAEYDDHGDPEFDRPLIVWAQHHEVMDELAHQVGAKLPELIGDSRIAIIDGRTSHNQRTRIVDDFQAGRIGVLIAQIAAAGVGITLTRSSDAIFAETDWSAPLIQQAEDRISRIGQTRPCMFTTLIAEGTLDPHIHRVRNEKDDLVSIVTGRHGRASGQQGTDAAAEAIGPSDILIELVDEQVDRRLRKTSRRKAA